MAAIRYAHSSTPVFERHAPDRMIESNMTFHPSIGNKPGKHQYSQ